MPVRLTGHPPTPTPPLQRVIQPWSSRSHYVARTIWSEVSSCFSLWSIVGCGCVHHHAQIPLASSLPHGHFHSDRQDPPCTSHIPWLLQGCPFSPSHLPLSPSVLLCCRSHTWSGLLWHWSSQKVDATGLMPILTVFCD